MCGQEASTAWRKANKPTTTHGHSRHPVYAVWVMMKARCINEKNHDYQWYGKRGIKVCYRWLNSFENFVADMGLPAKGMTLERINNDGNYTKNNCKWIPRQEQYFNTGSAHRITHKGVTRPLRFWARSLGISCGALLYRLKNWGVDLALTTPVDWKKVEVGRVVASRKSRKAQLDSIKIMRSTPRRARNTQVTFKP